MLLGKHHDQKPLIGEGGVTASEGETRDGAARGAMAGGGQSRKQKEQTGRRKKSHKLLKLPPTHDVFPPIRPCLLKVP